MSWMCECLLIPTLFVLLNVHSEPTTSLFKLGAYRRHWYSVWVLIVTWKDCSHEFGLDTGSSDLWVVSDDCIGTCTRGVPLYPHSSLVQTGLNVELLYGDSRTGTHATGPIGQDTVGIAGLAVKNQYFAAIVDTNTTIMETGSAGILGLGFPAIRSVLMYPQKRCPLY